MADVNAHDIVADVIVLADVIANISMYYIFMADLIAKGLCIIPLFTIGRCYCLIFVVDVETTFGRCYLPSGRWNSHMLQQMAGVICQMADVIATVGWVCLVIGMFNGRWNSLGLF